MHLHPHSLISITGLRCIVCRQWWNALTAKASAAATSVAGLTLATCPGITTNALALHEHLQLDPTTDRGSSHHCYLPWFLVTEPEGPTSFLPRRNVPAGKSSSSHTERKSAALGKGPASVEPGLAESSKEEKQNCN